MMESNDNNMLSGFGVAYVKQEGTPANPEDVYNHCGCEYCEVVWRRQLNAYNDFHTNKKEVNDHHSSVKNA